MKCKDVTEKLYDMKKGALPPTEMLEISTHLKHCPSCMAQNNAINEIRTIFRNTLEPVPDAVYRNIKASTSQKRGFSIPFLKPVPITAFALSLLLLFSLLKLTSAPKNQEDELAAFIYDSYAQSNETYDNEIPSNIEYVTYAY
ncbi:MAG: zf-HC2 domain-containing protein [Candidatus Goldbacteria bacterium]|nr:zf-HC2 domain-containing protein [Candidatus Goldiibacteriota bacterium]